MDLDSWTVVLIITWLYRYCRTVVNSISHWTFRPIPIPEDPSYDSQDVTIILPTIARGGEELETTLRTCLRTEPHELLLVTIDSNVKNLTLLANKINSKKIRVLSVPKANKRSQMCRAIPEVSTRITIFVDDDVIWPVKIMPWILAPFEDSKVGGVGTSQRLKRPKVMNGWVFLNAAYLERRNWDCSACLNIDGGLPCLSGRTAAYRTSILQDDAFIHEFTNEMWFAHRLNAADDDNFITRWLYSHDWKIKMQYHKEAEIQTTLEAGPKFLSQCLRWSRSNWRSNLTSMFVERHYWYTQSWSTYSVLLPAITAWALPVDALILTAAYKASIPWSDEQRLCLAICLAVWFSFCKTVKLWGLYSRYPVDIIYLPLSIAFGYFHGFIKAFALMTLSTTTWGSRDGADTDDRLRMQRLPTYGSLAAIGRESGDSFDFMPETQLADELPAYESHSRHQALSATTTATTRTTPYHD